MEGAHLAQNGYLRDERFVDIRVAQVEGISVARFLQFGAQRTTDKQIQSPDMGNLFQVGPICSR